MPSKEIIQANGLVESQLPPHLRKRRGGNNLVINNGSSYDPSKIYIAVGETVTAFKPLYISDDGKAYLADNVNHPAQAISITPGEANSVIEIAITGYEISVSETYDPGKVLYLGDKVLAITPDVSSGKIYQKLASVKSNNVIFVSIDNAYFIE